MTHDLELLNNMWMAVKPFIDNKERIHAADALIEMFDDHGLADDIIGEIYIDSDLKIAAVALLGAAEDEDEDDWE